MANELSQAGERTDEVASVIKAYGSAYSLGRRPFQITSVERFYSKSGPLVIAIPGAPDRLFLSWEEYSSAWLGFLRHFASFFFSTHGDLRVSRIGRVAWASQTGRSYGEKMDGSEFSRPLRQTLVLVLEDDTWRIVQEHVSLAA